MLRRVRALAGTHWQRLTGWLTGRDRGDVWVLVGYTLFALLLTWPLACHFTTHMPGNGIDDPALGWNLWWIKERLVDQVNLDIFHVDWMFHPIAINLAFYTLTPLNGLLSTPLQVVFGLTVANNLVLLSSFVLSGYGTFLLVCDLLAEQQIVESSKGRLAHSALRVPGCPLGPAFLAGLVYAFASPKLFYAALGQFNIASSQWIPFCVLYLLRMGRSTTLRQGLRNGAFAALFLVLQAWAELTYASFLLIFIAIYFGWLVVDKAIFIVGDARRRLKPSGYRTTPDKSGLMLADISFIASPVAAGLRSQFTIHNLRFTVLPFLLLGLLFLLGLSPFLAAMLPDLRAEGDFFTSGGGFSDIFSADLAGYLVPTRLHFLLGEWVAGLPFPNDVGQQIYIGYWGVGIAGIGAWRAIQNPKSKIQNQAWFWLCTTLFFWLMTLGPHVRWLGKATPIPGPFALISLLPFFNGNRYPSRYGVMVLLGVAVLVGYGAMGIRDWVFGRGRNAQSLISMILIGLFLFEHAAFPLPLNDFHTPKIYQTLGAQPGDFVVLELPTGWRNGARVLGKSDKLIMMQQWWQTVHGKRRLGGNTSRNPLYKFQYFTETPLLGDLIALMNADREHIQPVIDTELDALIARNRPIAAQVLADLGIEAVTVQVDKSPPTLLRFVDEVLPLTLVEEWQGIDWAGESSTIRLYLVEPLEISAERTFDLAGALSPLWLGAGWSVLPVAGGRYATRPSADLHLPLPTQGGELTLELLPPATSVRLSLNGVRLGADLHRATNGWLTVTVPAGVATEPVDRLTIQFMGAPLPVNELLTPPAPGWPMGATGVTLPGSLLVRSAGEEVGDFAQLWVNGVDVASNERGYHLVALDAAGQVLTSASFDTHVDAAQSTALAAWIDQWPTGTIIAGAIADEASNQLQQAAVDALRRIGVAGDLRGKFRWSHAFVGAVGAPPGSATEQMSLLHPATVFVGVPVDGEAVSGGIGKIRFTGGKGD